MDNFKPERWERLRDRYSTWWAGKAKTPILKASYFNNSQLPDGMVPMISQSNCHLLTIPAADIIDSVDFLCHVQDFMVTLSAFCLSCFGPESLQPFWRKTDNASGGSGFFGKECPPRSCILKRRKKIYG
jgi:hypothetical protein